MVCSSFSSNGPSIFARFLPFWVAVWGERALILMLPLLGVLLPLFRVGPPIYRWQIERKIYRWYKHLGRIERDAGRVELGHGLAQHGEQLVADL